MVENGQLAALHLPTQDPLLQLGLQRVGVLVRRAALEARLRGGDPQDPYRGLLISDEEVDGLLEGMAAPNSAVSHPLLDALDRQLAHLSAGLEETARDEESRLGRLLARLGLTPLERDILLLALLPEVDPRYGRLLAFLQDDVTRPRPGVFLALRLFCMDEAAQQGRSCFLPEAPLLRHRLIRLEGYPHDPSPVLLQQAIHADRRIVAYLLDGEPSDETPFPFLRRSAAGPPPAELLLPDEVREALPALVDGLRCGTISVVLLEGPAGSGRRTVARALAGELGRPLLELSAEPAGQAGPPAMDILRLSLREACLQGALLFCRQGAEGEMAALEAMGELVAAYGVPLLLSGERFTGLERAPAGTVRVAFPLPGVALRQRLWEAHLAGRSLVGINPADLAARYRLNGGQIRDAVAWAQGLALRGGRMPIEARDMEEAIAMVLMPTLDDLARAIVPRHTWNEIVLPDDVLAHLREFAAAIRWRDHVYEDWGFDRRRPLGKGLNALFAGPSGTGKTMAAEIIAGDLGLPLFRIDLSAVVSKYVGETEKHLRRLFSEAEKANVILFFDEADALFGKRSEVRDAHDRYANIEVAYLLQALEGHAGVCILATNLYGNLDDAFVRRMHFVIHFPFPDEAMRRRIWEVIFPAEAPLAEDVDREELARRFRVTGGHIRNIALGGAFLAAADGGVIGMRHLLQAARREFQKMGKVVSEGDFA